MNTPWKSFTASVKEALTQGMGASKKIISNASEKTKQIKDLGVLQVEVRVLEGKRKSLCEKLGVLAYERFGDKQTIAKTSPDIRDIVDSIQEMDVKIADKKAQIAKVSAKSSTAQPKRKPASATAPTARKPKAPDKPSSKAASSDQAD